MIIEIVPYDSNWPQEFQRLASDLSNVLGDMALRIDHIGSTAVQGLAAKDRIDIQVGVDALQPVLIERLTCRGFIHLPHLSDVPHGKNPVPEDWRKFVFTCPENERPANIHIRVLDRPNHRFALLFCDYLRAHPISRDAYAMIKKELAKLHPYDSEIYYAIKEPVFDILYEAMEIWAANSSWSIGKNEPA